MTKFLKMYGSEENHNLHNPIVNVERLYKFDYKTKSGGKHDSVLMAPCCHDNSSVYLIAGYRVVNQTDIDNGMTEYTTDLIKFIARAPDGAIIKTFKLNYADVEIGGVKVRREIEGEWIMEVE